mgnify:FL=1
MNIKKQIRTLYFYEVVSGFQIVDLVWVLFLIQRGFSLAEAGIAEGVFHAVSMCCEIPSGMVSDLLGRRRTLIAAGLVSALSSCCMIMTDCFSVILLAMGMNAVSYNLVSGTREALTYDSLLEAGQEERYLKVSSRQESIYQALCAATGLFSVVTVTVGYRAAYLISVGQGLCCAWIASRLKEAGHFGRKGKVDESVGEKPLSDPGCLEVPGSSAGKAPMVWRMGKELAVHFRKSFLFLKEHPRMRERMIVAGGISAGAYLVSMMLQEYLVTLGLAENLVGLPLFFISLFSVAGAFLGERSRKLNIRTLVWLGGSLAGLAMIGCGAASLPAVVAAAGAVRCMEEMTVLRLENENQMETASEIRATVISVGSMSYSLWMAVLSPVSGAAADVFSVPAAFLGLGLIVIILSWGYVLQTARKKVS